MAEDLTRSEIVGPAPGTPGTPPATRNSEPGVALEPQQAPTEEQIIPPRPRDSHPGPHAGRFLVAYALLGLVIAGTVIGFAMLTSPDGASTSATWSKFQPKSEGTEGVREIADYVSNRYRAPSRQPLVAVIPRSPKSMNLAAAAVDEQALFQAESQFKTYPLEDSMFYILCGTGANCSVGEGQASRARHRLLRREALELALYTFRYVDGVTSVITFLPPHPQEAQQQQQQQAPDRVVLFRADDEDIQTLLDRPLNATLPGLPPSAPDRIPQLEAALVDAMTLPTYRFEVQQSSDGQSGVLLLSPAQTQVG
ncbi:MAG: hypothetical protein ABR583_09995 [Gaiellaceae bacterium]